MFPIYTKLINATIKLKKIIKQIKLKKFMEIKKKVDIALYYFILVTDNMLFKI